MHQSQDVLCFIVEKWHWGKKLPRPLPPIERGVGGTLHRIGLRIFFDSFPYAGEPHNCILYAIAIEDEEVIAQRAFYSSSSPELPLLLWTAPTKLLDWKDIAYCKLFFIVSVCKTAIHPSFIRVKWSTHTETTIWFLNLLRLQGTKFLYISLVWVNFLNFFQKRKQQKLCNINHSRIPAGCIPRNMRWRLEQGPNPRTI